MRYLVDTHLLLWAANEPERLSGAARTIIDDIGHELMFSAAAIWECAIKTGMRRTDFDVDATVLRRGLMENGYRELPMTSVHASSVADLPDHHRDPFDRIQIAQARTDGIAFLTSDALLARYGRPVEVV